jgi:hypothetical protein
MDSRHRDVFDRFRCARRAFYDQCQFHGRSDAIAAKHIYHRRQYLDGVVAELSGRDKHFLASD